MTQLSGYIRKRITIQLSLDERSMVKDPISIELVSDEQQVQGKRTT